MWFPVCTEFYFHEVLYVTFFLCTAIGNAFAVLSDPDKRQRYDQFGDENPQPRIYRDHYDYARGFEGPQSIHEHHNIYFL